MSTPTAEWLTPSEAAAHLRISLPMLRKLTRAQRLPQPVKLGSRTLRWRRTDIDAHLVASRPESGVSAIDRRLGLR